MLQEEMPEESGAELGAQVFVVVVDAKEVARVLPCMFFYYVSIFLFNTCLLSRFNLISTNSIVPMGFQVSHE